MAVMTENFRTPDDQVLAVRAAAGCPASFEDLVDRHTGRLLGYLIRRTGNRHDAEDLVQETWVRAYRYLGSYDPARAFPAWLFRIASNLANDRAGRRKEAAAPAREAAREGEDGSVWSTADRVLPRAQREALWLFYGEGLSVREVASVMGKSGMNVKVMLYRARTRLGEELRSGPDGSRSALEFPPHLKSVE